METQTKQVDKFNAESVGAKETRNKLPPLAQMQCKKCGNRDFQIRYTAMPMDKTKSLLLDCKCGRVVEIRGLFEAIEMNPWEVE